jgi:peptide/nickel transport system permease protein
LTESWILFKRNLSDFWKTFRRNRMGMTGAALVLAAVLVAVIAPMLSPYDPATVIRDEAGRGLTFAPPSVHGPLGTDDAGRDVWTQLVYGARISLTVGFLAGFIAMFVGSMLGTLAGYFGGWLDNLLMRITDVLLVIPDLPLMLVLVATLRQMELKISPLAVLILVIGLLYWTSTARLVRSQVLSIKERQFVARARAIGAGHFHIIRKHILPQIMPLIVANTVLILSTAILIESGPGFPRPGRPDPALLGNHAQFCLRPQRHQQRGLVVLPAAGAGDCLGFARLRAARQRIGGNAQPAPDRASSRRRSASRRNGGRHWLSPRSCVSAT